MALKRKSLRARESVKRWFVTATTRFTSTTWITPGYPMPTPTLETAPHDLYQPWSALTSAEKQELVDRSHILHGIQLQYPSALSFANAPVALLPADAPFPAQPMNMVAFTSQSVYSAAESALVDKGFSALSARLAVPFVGAHAGAERGKERSSGAAVAALFVTARYVYPRTLVKTTFEDLVPNPDFVRDVEAALAVGEESAQIVALKRALEAWGQVITTYAELGCSLVSSTELVSTSVIHDRKQEHAVKAGLEVIIAKYAGGVSIDIGSSKEEKAAAKAWAQRLDVRVIGGTSSLASSIKDLPQWRKTVEDPGSWAIIGIDGVRATIDLLAGTYPDLYALARPLADKLKAQPPPLAPAPPIFHFPHRLSCWKYQSLDHWRPPSYVEAWLPAFAPGAEYTLSARVLVGARGMFAHGAFLSVECPARAASLVRIGFDVGRQYFAARVGAAGAAGELRVDARAKGAFETKRWYHVALVKEGQRLRLYVDGTEVDSVPSPLEEVPQDEVVRPRICLGRAASEDSVCDGWDGQVEDVKVWARALSKEELEVDSEGKSLPGGWNAKRFAGC